MLRVQYENLLWTPKLLRKLNTKKKEIKSSGRVNIK